MGEAKRRKAWLERTGGKPKSLQADQTPRDPDWGLIDFTGWGAADFPLQALRQGHADGLSMLDFAESLRAHELEMLEEFMPGEDLDDKERALAEWLQGLDLDAQGAPADHFLAGFASEVLAGLDDPSDRRGLIELTIREHAAGVTLADLAKRAEVEDWCRLWE